jgi:nucleoside-diphosphate-sugar epimerase
MTRALALALGKDNYFSHERAQKDLGYTPQITIEEGLSNLIDLMRLQVRPREESNYSRKEI